MLMDEASSALVALGSRRESAPCPLQREVASMFDQWRAPLLGYLVTLRLPVEDGEEVVQEVFLALFQHLRSGKSRENLRGWVFRVGHNLALKRRTAVHRQVSREAVNALDGVRDTALNPEQMMALKQRETRLQAVVAAFPEQDRCCLHLRAEGFRYREIAEVLGISLGSVAASVARSLGRLKQVDR